MGRGLRIGSAAACLFAFSCVDSTGVAAERGDVRIDVLEPAPGATVQGRFDTARLQGVARAGKRETAFDVVLVIDVSGSTKYPSGIDVNGNGVLGGQSGLSVPGGRDTFNTDPGDSVLAAQIQAARALLSGLDASHTRVGIVSFSGDFDPSTGRRLSQHQADARVEHPLTHDYARLQAALEAVELRGPHGGTNMAAGVKAALGELAGLPGSASKPRPGAKRVMLLLTDGKPSLPYGSVGESDPEDIDAVIDAARLAKVAGVLTNVYGLGKEAIDYPIAAEQLAEITGGLYTPVRKPGDIVTILNGVSFANVEDVVAINLTLADMAGPEDIQLRPDGSFTGYVPVRLGRNRIRVSALASDGSRGSVEFEIMFKRPKLTSAEQNAELNRIRRRNRELQLLMERERQSAFRKSEKERAVTIEIEEDEEKRP